MNKALINLLHCPVCQTGDFSLEDYKEDSEEIIGGSLICKDCSTVYEISNGLLFFYKSLSQEALLERMASEAEDSLIKESEARQKRLEKISNDNAKNFLNNNLGQAHRILELGAGTGWLSAEISSARQVIALDMYYKEPRGLLAAKNIMNEKRVYFERLIADMKELPFKDSSFDLVIVCAALHHSPDLIKTCNEVFRILKPGARFILLSEPVKGLLGTNERKIIADDLEHGFHEKRYSVSQWINTLRRAGFKTKTFLPINMSEVLATRNRYGRFLKFVWEIIPNFIKPYLTKPSLTIFDGFFNVVAIKPLKS